MRLWVSLIVLIAATGCTVEGDPRQKSEAGQATKLAAGQWEITIAGAQRPGAPGQAEPRTVTTWLSAADAINPPAHFFGGCRPGDVTVSGGEIEGDMPCSGDGAVSNAIVSINGTYDRDSFEVTVDTHVMGTTVREERRGRHLRS